MYRFTCLLPLCRDCGFSVQGLVKGTFKVPSREHPSDCLPPRPRPPSRLGICEVGWTEVLWDLWVAPGPASRLLCGFGEVASPLWASVYPSDRWARPGSGRLKAVRSREGVEWHLAPGLVAVVALSVMTPPPRPLGTAKDTGQPESPLRWPQENIWKQSHPPPQIAACC